jgi:hypothetical protein
LVAVGRKRDGTPLPRELAEQYVRNSMINELIDFRTEVAQALFDLKLWNQPYSMEPGSLSFVDHANKMFNELMSRATRVQLLSGDLGRSPFVTNHFTSGNVRYFSYVVARVAATMSVKSLLDDFETATGRRTLYQQPDMAQLLIEGYFKKGFEKKFPEATESFTGKKFSPEIFVEQLRQYVREYISSRQPKRLPRASSASKCNAWLTDPEAA